MTNNLNDKIIKNGDIGISEGLTAENLLHALELTTRDFRETQLSLIKHAGGLDKDVAKFVPNIEDRSIKYYKEQIHRATSNICNASEYLHLLSDKDKRGILSIELARIGQLCNCIEILLNKC